MPIFDVPASRLIDLSDADLRELVARLCEAERERQGGHRNDVRWGGSQTAADGGLDVVVDPVGPFLPIGPLSRRHVGIQVKKADLQPAEITNEMQDAGGLRAAISLLAANGGAYIIASARANCSEIMLQRRTAAMSAAVAGDPSAAAIELIFLDQNALSRWVSAHPPVAAWLRPRLGLPTLNGWQPYGRWSSTPAGESDDLICEQGITFRIGRDETITNVPDGLDAIRSLVRDGTGAVRLAGLSGVGKSRLVQALFENVGAMDALPSTHALYTDVGHSPEPTPIGMLEAVQERNEPLVIVIDNCPPETHHALARLLAERPGPVRLITVEYDVRADLPEATDVVRVEAEGSKIVEALLRRRHPNLSAGEADRLAELAQGNARLGFALAQAAPEAGTLSSFNDAVLFDRLFWQREERNNELARAADVLSLVYSFEVEGDETPDELTFLGSLTEISRPAMHRHAVTLFDRNLTQARGRWRAILPHALANRLARQALSSIPLRDLADGFADKPRLLRSFSKRLSYLHDSDEARRIVTRWMEAGGPLHGPSSDVELLEAVCHLAPEECLAVVDEVIAAIPDIGGGSYHHDSLMRSLLRIAHSGDLFSNVCHSLFTLVAATDSHSSSHASEALEILFGLFMSGTLAQTDARVAVARECLASPNEADRSHGIRMLNSALRTDDWSPAALPHDHALPDPFGWQPEGADVDQWYASWLEVANETALNGAPESIREARRVLADRIANIWKRVPALRRRVEEVAGQVHASEPWAEGRQSIVQMLHYSRNGQPPFPPADLVTINRLVVELEPADLEARVRTEMAKGWDYDLDFEEMGVDEAETQRSMRLEQLGRELAADVDALRAVGRDLLEVEGGSFFTLGRGLARTNGNPIEVWTVLRDLHLINPAKTRNTNILSGFIQNLDVLHPDLSAEVRAECRAAPALRVEYGVFLPAGVLPQAELEHVIEIAAEPETSVWQFTDVSWRQERELSDDNRVRLLRVILPKQGGEEQVVDALRMLRHVERDTRESWPNNLRELGLDAIVGLLSSEGLNDLRDERISRALTSCLRGDDGQGATRAMTAIIERAARRYGSTYDVSRTFSILAERSPAVFLTSLFPDDADGPVIQFREGRRPLPIMSIPSAFLIGWCGERAERWAKVAPHINPFSRENREREEATLFSPLANAFLDAAPRPQDVVEAFFGHLSPMSWSGSRAAIIESRLDVFEVLAHHPSPEVRDTVSRLARGVRTQISDMYSAEAMRERDRDERFE